MDITILESALNDALKDYIHNTELSLKDFTYWTQAKESNGLNPANKEQLLQEAIKNLNDDGISIIWLNTDDLTLCPIKINDDININEAIKHCEEDPEEFWKLDTNIYLDLD